MPTSIDTPWYEHINIDLIARVLQNSIFHPFIAWLIPLCLRARALPYDHPAMIYTAIYASIVTVFAVLQLLNVRVAYGAPRKVNLGKEVVVITGGASGLGLLIAEVYGMRGVSVAVLDVRPMDGEGRGVEFYQCDVGDLAQVQKAATAIEEDLGTPTILINNAGIVNGRPVLELSSEQLDRNFRVNLLSHFHTIQTFLPGMLRKKQGTIVTVASVLGHVGCKNLSDYCAAKAGLIALHESLTAEIPEGSNVNLILVKPGQLSTPLFAGLKTPSSFLAPVVEPVDVAKEIIATVDAGRNGVLAMPLYARWVQILGVMPVGFQRLLRRLDGRDKAMDGFIGRRAK